MDELYSDFIKGILIKLHVVTTSWDDGHKLDLKLANLLQKYNIKGTFYISPFYLKDRLSETEIKQLDRYHEIGAHTLTHVDLRSISIKEAENEIGNSKLYLEKVLGHELNMFCYPKGLYNEQIKKIVRNYGFLGARTCNYGSFKLPTDPFEWQITLLTSNGSPLMAVKTILNSKIPIKAILDWEIRAKLLFDVFLRKGGVYHIWGHSWEIEQHDEWDKLERLLDYVSGKNEVQYRTNGEILQEVHNRTDAK